MQASKEDKKTLPFAGRSNSLASATARQGEKRSVVFNQDVQDHQTSNITSVAELRKQNAPNTSNQVMISAGQNVTQQQQQQQHMSLSPQQQQQTQDSLHQILPYNQDMMRSLTSISRNNLLLPVGSNFPMSFARGPMNINAPIPTQMQAANCQLEPLYNCLATLISNILPLVAKEPPSQPTLPPVDPDNLYVGMPCTAGPCCIKNFLKTPAQDLKTCCFKTSLRNAAPGPLKRAVCRARRRNRTFKARKKGLTGCSTMFMSDPVENPNPKTMDASQTTNGVLGQATDAVQTALPDKKEAKAVETENSSTSTSAVSNSAKSIKETKEQEDSLLSTEVPENDEESVHEGMLSKTIAGDPRFLMMAKVRRPKLVASASTSKNTKVNNYQNKTENFEDDDNASTFDEEIPSQPGTLTEHSMHRHDPEYDETFHTEVSSMVRGKVSHYTEFSSPKQNYRMEQSQGQDQVTLTQDSSSSPKPTTDTMINSESLMVKIPPTTMNARNSSYLTKQRKSKNQIAAAKDNRPTRTSSRKKDGNGPLTINALQKESKDTKHKK